MATTAQMYDEIARILRETRNNVEYEGERNKSQLLCDVAVTIDNLATLVQNISTEVKAAQEKESNAFVIACAYIINHERYNNAYNLFIERFTKRV